MHLVAPWWRSLPRCSQCLLALLVAACAVPRADHGSEGAAAAAVPATSVTELLDHPTAGDGVLVQLQLQGVSLPYQLQVDHECGRSWQQPGNAAGLHRLRLPPGPAVLTVAWWGEASAGSRGAAAAWQRAERLLLVVDTADAAGQELGWDLRQGAR